MARDKELYVNDHGLNYPLRVAPEHNSVDYPKIAQGQTQTLLRLVIRKSQTCEQVLP